MISKAIKINTDLLEVIEKDFLDQKDLLISYFSEDILDEKEFHEFATTNKTTPDDLESLIKHLKQKVVDHVGYKSFAGAQEDEAPKVNTSNQLHFERPEREGYKDVDQLRAVLSRTIDGLLDGTIRPNVAKEVTKAADTMISSVKVELEYMKLKGKRNVNYLN